MKKAIRQQKDKLKRPNKRIGFVPDEEMKTELEAKRLLIFKSNIKKLRLHLVAAGVSLFILALIVAAIGDKTLFKKIRTFAMSHPSFLSAMQGISDCGNYIFYAIFIGIGIHGLVRKKYMLFAYAVVYFSVQIIASVLLTRILKIAFARMRPGDWEYAYENEKIRYDSFPSGHTSDMASSASTLSYFTTVYFLRFFSYLCVALMGFSRISVGSHYPLDVIGGAFIGLFSGYIVCHIFARRFIKQSDN